MITLDRIDREQALRYMAYTSGSNIGEIAAGYLDECEYKLLDCIRPKYAYRSFCLSWEGERPFIPDCTLQLAGNSIAAHLKGCTGIIIFAATLGPMADRLIRRYQAEDMAKAVMTDAFASTAAEQVCDIAEGQIKEKMGEGYFTWRYSPGYGDFPLSLQKSILDITEAPKRIGLCVSKSGLLTPIKSVTAVMGISPSPLPSKIRGCVTCNAKNVCELRKRGLHCGF